MEYRLYTEVEDIILDYETRNVQIMPGLLFNAWKMIKTAEFYSNSKYLFGNQDDFGRDKPFYNITNYRVTLAKVATDLDIKDVQIGSDNPEHYVHSMLLQKEAYEWMKATNFAEFLNDMGQTRPKYGGVLVKRTYQKKKGKQELHIDVVDWRNVAVDQVDILAGAIAETHYLTPVELMKKEKVWDLSDLTEIIKVSEKASMGSEFDTREDVFNTDRIVVREVTGEFSEADYADFNGDGFEDEDIFTYSLQHYFYADVNGKCYPLYCEKMKETDFQYKYLPWEKMPGRALGRGVIEDAEEAQVWTNDAVINEKNAMDLAGKVVMVTDSKQASGNLLEVDNGRIFELELGRKMEALNLSPAALGEFENQVRRWQDQANDSTFSYDANTGKQPPADTPYSQTALLNQVASKPFDYRREEAGIFLTQLFDDWIIPYLVKKLYAEHVLASDFTDEELEVIDNAFAMNEVNKKVVEQVLAGKIVNMQQYQDAIQAFRTTLKGNRRFLQVPDGFFDDIEAKVTVLTTGEQKNKAAILQSLSTIMGDVMKTYDPQSQSFAILDNPIMARIFGTVLELSGAGISPASLGIGKPQMPASQMPQNAPPGGGQPPTPAGQPPAPLSQPVAAPVPAGGLPSAMQPAAVQNLVAPAGP